MQVPSEPLHVLVPIGWLRFPRQRAHVPASIALTGTSFLEVYSGASTHDHIEPWTVRKSGPLYHMLVTWVQISMMAFGNGVPAASARSQYPAHPVAEARGYAGSQ